jgi:hypothetical protein
MAHCPAHDDRRPSLSVSDGGDKVLVNCFAGCDTKAVLDRLDLGFPDLFDVSYCDKRGLRESRGYRARGPRDAEDRVRYLAWELGVDSVLVDVRQKFPCLFYRGHRAALRFDDHGRPCYVAFAYPYRRRGKLPLWTLGEVHHALAAGLRYPKRLEPPSRVVWERRLEVEAELADIAEVELPSLAGLSVRAQTLARGYARLCAIRADLKLGTEPVPFTRSFAAAWCGMTANAARRAHDELLSLLTKAGETTSKAGRPIPLYQPWPVLEADAPWSAPASSSSVEAGLGQSGLLRGEVGGVEALDPAHEVHELELVAGAEFDVGAGGPLDAVEGAARVPHGLEDATPVGGRS